MKKTITYKDLKEFLLTFYALNSVKHILRKNHRQKPRFEIMQNANKQLGVPFEAWVNISDWLKSQKHQNNKPI